MENMLFDPHSGWYTGGGYPSGHLSFVHIFVFIEKLTSDQLITWSISRGQGAVENVLFGPPLRLGHWWGVPKRSFKLRAYFSEKIRNLHTMLPMSSSIPDSGALTRSFSFCPFVLPHGDLSGSGPCPGCQQFLHT